MASSSSCLSGFVVVICLLMTMSGSHGRESHFFSKVTKDEHQTGAPTVSTLGKNEDKDEVQKNNNGEQPSFTTGGGGGGGESYGLYGHDDTTTLPTDAYGTPYKTTTSSNEEEYSNNNQNSNSLYNTNNNHYSNNHDSLYTNTNNKDSYLTNDEKPRSGPVTYTTSNNDDINSASLLNNNNNYNYKKQQQQQGLSDTRFMEGGKYFYDINDDQKYYPTYNRYEDSRSTSTNSGVGGYYNHQNGGNEGYKNTNFGIGGDGDGDGESYYNQNNEEEQGYNNADANKNTNYVFNNEINSIPNTEAYSQNQEQQEFQEVQAEFHP